MAVNLKEVRDSLTKKADAQVSAFGASKVDLSDVRAQLNKDKAPEVTVSKPVKTEPQKTIKTETPTASVGSVESSKAEPEGKQSIWQRVRNVLSGSEKQYLASQSQAIATAYNGTSVGDVYSENAEAIQKRLDLAKKSLSDPGNTPEDIEDIKWTIQMLEGELAKSSDAARAVKETPQAAYEMARDLNQSGAEDIQKAQEGLGFAGQLIVNAASSTIQSSQDALVSAALGMPQNMIPFAMRSFGGGIIEAKNAGLSDEQAVARGLISSAKEVATEKMFNMNILGRAAYGKGSMDDIVEKGIESAVNRFAKTAAGKDFLEGVLNASAAMLSEGLEEFVGDWAEYALAQIDKQTGFGLYSDNEDTFKDAVENSFYDFLVGSVSGMFGDVGGRIANNQVTRVAGSQINRANATGDMLQTAQNAAEGTEARKYAERYSGLDKLSNYQAGRLAQAVAETNYQDVETDRILAEAVADARAGRTPSVDYILGNEQALEALTKEAGLSLNQEMSRDQVADAVVKALSSANEETGFVARNTERANNRERNGKISAYVKVIRDYSANGEITAKTVDAIVGDKDAQNALGIELTNEMSDREKRQIVKNAAENIVRGKDTTGNQFANSTVQRNGESGVNIQPGTKGSQNGDFAAQNGIDKTFLNEAKSALGSEGQKALVDNYDGSIDSDVYVKEFFQAYQAAVEGRDLSAREHLSTEQNYNAIQAGIADRVKKQVSQNRSVTRSGKAGFDYKNEKYAPKEMTKSTIKALDSIGKALGVEIKFLEADEKANGYIIGNTIYIAADSQNPIFDTIKHEVSHRLQDLAPEQYDLYKAYVKSVLSARGDLESSMESYKSLYAEENLTEDQILDEIVSDYTAEMFENVSEFKKLVRANDTLAQKLHNALSDIIDKIRGYKGYGNAERAAIQDVLQAERLWADALKQAKLAVKKTRVADNTDEAARYSIKEITGLSGKVYGIGVILDSNLLTGLSEDEQKEMVKARVALELAGKSVIAYDKNNNAVNIEFAKPNEKFVNSQGQKRLVNDDLMKKFNGKAIKRESVVVADELIEASKDDGEHPAKKSHDWLDNYGKNKWNYRNVYVQERDGSVWEATLNIANANDGRKILYDIDPIKMTEGSVKSVPTTVTNTVSQTGENNKRNSLKNRPDVDADGEKLSAAQVEYFKDSKIRNDEGQLIKVWHGSPKDFTVFDTELWGAYFSENKWYSERYARRADGSTGNLNSYYLNITNPFDTRIPAIRKIWENEFYRKYGNGAPLSDIGLPDWTDGDDLVDFARERGYDGVMLYEGSEFAEAQESGLRNRGISYIILDPNQAKLTSNQKPTEHEDIRFSLKPSTNNIGYHAGDLGKSTGDDYYNQGYGRHSGHFGFGTYFVGDKAQLDLGNYRKRPIETVDFSDYKLFRPSTEEKGFKLHDALRFIDGYIDDIELQKMGFDEFYNWEHNIKEAMEATDLRDTAYYEPTEIKANRKTVDNFVAEMPSYYENKISTAARNRYEAVQRLKADEESVTKDLKKRWNDYAKTIFDNWTEAKYIEKNLADEMKSREQAKQMTIEDWQYAEAPEVINEYLEAKEEERRRFKNLNFDLRIALGFGSFTEEEIDEALQKTAEIVSGYDKTQRGNDTAATVFMKQLGYEGVDVRGYEGLDNTGYGSVIYDLKGKALERKNEIGTARFSMRHPIEEKNNLVALHNLTEDNLKDAIDIGGFAMPSIAVVKAETGHTQYGPISIVFPKSTIDPKNNRANKLYGADAWTPTIPQTYYKADSKVADRVYDEMEKLVDADVRNALGFPDLTVSGISDRLDDHRGSVPDSYGNNDTLKYAFLKDSGRILEVPYTEDRFDGFYGHDNEIVKKVAADFTQEEVENILHQGSSAVTDELKERLRKLLNEAYKPYTEDMYEEPLTFSEADQILRAVKNSFVYTKPVIDRSELRKMIDTQVDQKQFEEWLDKKFEGIIEKKGLWNGRELFTPSGNRRSWESRHMEVTLDNIVKAMKLSKSKGGTALFGGTNLEAVASKDYKSIAELKKDSSRLQKMSDEEYTALKQDLIDRMSEITSDIMDKSYDNQFIAYDNAATIIGEAIERSRTAQGIQNYLEREYGQWYNIKPDTGKEIAAIVNAMSQLPTKYFEAKPERAVGFNEVLAAVLPDDSSDEFKQSVRDAGMSVLEYKAGDEEDRLEKVNSIEGARFSLKKSTDLQKRVKQLERENVRLQRASERLKKEIAKMGVAEPKNSDFNLLADRLIADYALNTTAFSRKDLISNLREIYSSYMSDNESERAYQNLKRSARDLAKQIIRNAGELDNEQYQEYAELRERLKTTQLVISKKDASNIADYNEWRKGYFGKIKVRLGSETNVDKIYHDLAETYPELFGAEGNPADELQQIADVAESLYVQTYNNPFAGEEGIVSDYAANDIIASLLNLRTDAKLEDMQRANKVATAEAVAKVRAERDMTVRKLQEKFRARNEADRQRQINSYRRKQIVKAAQQLSSALLRPNKSKFITEDLRATVASLLNALNLESNVSYDEGGRLQRNTKGRATKRTEAARALRNIYSEWLKDHPDMVYDEELMDNIESIESMGDKPLGSLSSEELETVYKVVRAVHASVVNENKAFAMQNNAAISDIAEALQDENGAKRAGRYVGLGKAIQDSLNLNMLTPEAFFHRLGKTGNGIFKALRNAQDKQIRLFEDAVNYTQKIIGDTDIRKLESENHEFDIDGQKITLTTAQIMALYELSKRQQALDHMFIGGIRSAAMGGKGLDVVKDVSNVEPARLMPETLGRIIDTLTPEQKKMADKLQQYMATVMADWGNDTSMRAYGYKKFTEKEYFPITVDNNTVASNISTDDMIKILPSFGMTKNLTPHANNPLVVSSIFDVFAKHANEMSTWASWYGIMQDLNRVRNYKFENGNTVKRVLENVYGSGGNAYITKLANAISAGSRSDEVTPITSRLTGAAKAASVGLNLRVIMQQPTAVLRAAAMIDPQYLAKGFARKGDWEKVKRYSAIAAWKDWGYFDVSMGRQIKDVMFNTDSPTQRIRNIGGELPNKADSFAWSRLWNAVEYEVLDKTTLQYGSDEFNKAVAERFNDIIDRTQVVDGVLQRSQYLRSTDRFTKMASAFMSEPTKIYNMMLSALYDYHSADTVEGKVAAKKMIARTCFALTSSFVVNAFVQSIVDAWRDDDRDKGYLERFLEKYIGYGGEGNFVQNFFNSNLGDNYNLASYIPGYKDAMSILQGYQPSRMDTQGIYQFWQNFTSVWKALHGGSGKYTPANATIELLAAFARLTGIGVANVKRDLEGIGLTVLQEAGEYTLMYKWYTFLYNPKNNTSKAIYYDLAYEAYKNDKTQYNEIRKEMISDGFKPDNIDSAMKSRKKKEAE